jgi:DnaK suppressor protein
MDDNRARQLLTAERQRVERDLADLTEEAGGDRDSAGETGDIADPAEPLTAQQGDDAVAAQLRDRLAAIGRAEARLEAGTYGRSVASGAVIPDDRLEADPAAELTVEEASGA